MRYSSHSRYSPLRAIPEAVSIEELGARYEGGGEAFLSNISDAALRPDQTLESEQSRRAVKHFIDAMLTSRERALVRRVFWDEERQAAVAKELGISRAAITQMLNRVLAKGRTQLAAHEPRADEYVVQATIDHDALMN